MATMTQNTDNWSVTPNRSNQPIQINTNGKYMDRNILIDPMLAAVPHDQDHVTSNPFWTTQTPYNQADSICLRFLKDGGSGYVSDQLGIKGVNFRGSSLDNLTFSVKMHKSRPCTTTIDDGVNEWVFTRDADGNIYVV